MTVKYWHKISTVSDTFSSCRLLLTLKGHFLRLISKDLLMIIFCYYTLHWSYFAMKEWPGYEPYTLKFEKICLACYHMGVSSSSPVVSLLLAFYLSSIFSRWWNVFECLNWLETTSMKLLCFAPSKEAKPYRTNIVRYLNLSNIITLRNVSSRVMRAFPSLDILIEHGLMSSDEAKEYEAIKAENFKDATWLPCVWACAELRKMLDKGLFADYLAFNNLVEDIKNIQVKHRTISSYAWVNFSLAYTQVVMVATYIYIAVLTLSCQNLQPEKENHEALEWKEAINLYNKFSLIKIVLFTSMLKVALSLINPFGEDDDDVFLEQIVDANLQSSFLIAKRDCDADYDQTAGAADRGNGLWYPGFDLRLSRPPTPRKNAIRKRIGLLWSKLIRTLSSWFPLGSSSTSANQSSNEQNLRIVSLRLAERNCGPL